jgi:hypothetical protein
MNTNDKIYTAKDFANYHAGTMPMQEMYALEKATLDDPFLADALEGYAYTNTAENDLAFIQEKIIAKTAPHKSFWLNKSTAKTWLSAAAVFILMGTVAYYFYIGEDEKTTTAIAEVKEIKNPPVLQKYDSVKPAPPEEIRLAQNENNPFTKKPKASAPPETTVNDDKLLTAQKELIAKKDEETTKEKMQIDALQNSKMLNNQNYANYYMQQGNVKDLKGGPLQNVIVKDKYNNATITDNNGQFKLRSLDSNAELSLASVGYESKKVVLNTNVTQNITLENANNSLSEVVVFSDGVSKKSSLPGVAAKNASEGLSGKVAGVNVESSTAVTSQPSVKIRGAASMKKQPDILMANTTAFDQYVKNNKIPIFDENNIPQNGIVRLLFFVDKNGRPKNIEVVSSTCKACNAQAITLLKNGPVWLTAVLQYKYADVTF